MGDDIIPIVTRFHREVVLPDIQRTVKYVALLFPHYVDRVLAERRGAVKP